MLFWNGTRFHFDYSVTMYFVESTLYIILVSIIMCYFVSIKIVVENFTSMLLVLLFWKIHALLIDTKVGVCEVDLRYGKFCE